MVFENSYVRDGVDKSDQPSHWFEATSLKELNNHIDQATHHLHSPLEALAVSTRPLFFLGIMCSSRLNAENSPAIVESLRSYVRELCLDNVIDGVVLGGGPGLMAVAMETAKQCGKITIAVKLPFDNEKDLELDHCTDIAFVSHEFGFRNAVFLALNNHYVYDWGGWGTLMELFTHLQARQMAFREFNTGVHQLPRTANALDFLPRLSFVGPMYRKLMDLNDSMLEAGTIKPDEGLVAGLPLDYEEDHAFGRFLEDGAEVVQYVRRSKRDWEQKLASFYQQYPDLKAEDEVAARVLKEWSQGRR